MTTHKGIEIRATIDGAPILHSNSYMLHLMGQRHIYTAPHIDGYEFPPAPEGWRYLLGMPFAPAPGKTDPSALVILYRPTETTEPPDDEDTLLDEMPISAWLEHLKGWRVTPSRTAIHDACGRFYNLFDNTSDMYSLLEIVKAHRLDNPECRRG